MLRAGTWDLVIVKVVEAEAEVEEASSWSRATALTLPTLGAFLTHFILYRHQI